MQKKKLLLAGSHGATTAAATIDEIQSKERNIRFYWVGKKWATEDKKSETLEYKILPKMSVKFMPIESGKIQTKFTRYTIGALLKIPIGFIQAASAVLKIKPNAILSFGGAAGAQVAFWGWVFGIPVVIHEQTSTAGRANIESSIFAKKIAISNANSKKYFPIKKTVLTGNPISKNIIALFGRKRSKELKHIFVTGGSRGSKWINDAILPIIDKLSEKYQITLQVGQSHKNDFSGYENKKSTNSKKIIVHGQISPDKYANILKKTDLLISRAGSNTVLESIITKTPSILIPIPWSYLNEQHKNAEEAKKLGLARIIPQKELNPQRLLKEIENMSKNYEKVIEITRNIESKYIQASKKLADVILGYL